MHLQATKAKNMQIQKINTNSIYNNKQQNLPAFEARLCGRVKKLGDSGKLFDFFETLAKVIAQDKDIFTTVDVIRTGERSGELRFYEPWEWQGIGESIAINVNRALAEKKISAGVVFIPKENKYDLF